MLESEAIIHSEAEADQLRYRKAQLPDLQDTFFEMKWNEKQKCVITFEKSIRSVSTSLQTPVTDEFFLNRFRARLKFRF